MKIWVEQEFVKRKNEKAEIWMERCISANDFTGCGKLGGQLGWVGTPPGAPL
jgi:hypothetical protein